MIENQSEGMHIIENNEAIDRKKKKRKHDKSIDSEHNKNNVSSDSLNTFLINMFSDGSTDDWSVRDKKKKKHLEMDLENDASHPTEKHHSDEDTKRLETGQNEIKNSKRRHSESEILTNNEECFVRNVKTHNNMAEFFQEDSIVTPEKKLSKKNHSFSTENTEIYTQAAHSKTNGFSDEQQNMLNHQEITPKKPKKMKLEVKTPETDINRKQIESESAGEEAVLKKKDKHKVSENFSDSITEKQIENEVIQKRKDSVGDKNTEIYNGDEQCEKNNFFDDSTPKKSKKIKLEMKTPEAEPNHKPKKRTENESSAEEDKHKASISEIQPENEVKEKKKKHKDKSDAKNRLTSASSISENTCSNSEGGIPSKKKKKKHKDEVPVVPSQEEVTDVPQKKKKKDKDKSDDRNRHTSASSTCENSCSNSEDEISSKKKKKKKKKHKEELSVVPSQEEVTDVPQKKKKKKKKDKDKSDDRNRHTSASSTCENTCSNSEDEISSKKKKKKKHKEEVSVVSSQEEVYDVPEIKKKKKRKHKDKIYKSLPIKMKQTDRLLEDSYISSDYSINNEHLASPAVQNFPQVDDLSNPHKKWQEISSDLYTKAEEQRESSHEVARSESVSSPDTFTIEVQEDKGSTLNGSFSPNDKKKRPTSSINERLKKKCFDEPVNEEKDYDYIIAERLEENYKNSTLDEDKLRLGRLYIIISWKVPPLHLIETRVANRPTPNQKAQIDLLDVKVKAGIFTKQEDEKIRQNFKEFCREHDFLEDPTPFLNFVHDKEVVLPCLERIKFVRYLARGLNDRLLCSVYRRFRRLFRESEMKTGKFSDEEDKIILHYIAKYTKTQTPFANLGRILKRDKLAVEKRYKKLTAPSEETQWTSDRIEELLKVLVNVTGCGTTEELRHWDITSEDWAQVSSSFKLSATKLRHTWLYSIYPKVFTPETINRDEIKIRLVNILRDNKETDWRGVNWDEIALHFEGFTGASLNKLLKNMVDYHVPPNKQGDLGRSLKFLSKKFSNLTGVKTDC